MEENLVQQATLANLIEIGKRAILKLNREDIEIPQSRLYDAPVAPGGSASYADIVAEDLAAALGAAIRDKKLKEGVTNA